MTSEKIQTAGKTVLEAIRSYAAAAPGKPAVIDLSRTLTYGEYWDRICAAAEFLSEKGIGRKDYVVVKSAQTAEYLVLCHAIQLAGAVCVPLEKTAMPQRIGEIVLETKASAFFGDVTVEGVPCFSLDAPAAHENHGLFWDMPGAEEESMVLFTTGTTGKSKGIVVTYGAEYAVAENVLYGVEMKKDNVEVIPMPMNHSFSLRRYFANMINGSTAVILDGVFFVKLLFQMMDSCGATALALAPAALGIIFRLSGDRIGEYADRLDYVQFGSAPLPEADKEHLLRLLPGCRLYNLYGSTEAGCACILNFNSPDNRPSCIGYPTRNSRFAIVDEKGREIEADAENPGYLSYTGAMLMKGYFGDPELTARAVEGGYLRTSDLGYRDGAGRIYMLGRADDVILTGGHKVSPSEVEEAAKKFPGVQDCVCTGKKDDLAGMVPALYIVSGKDLEISGLEAYLNEELEDFKRPRVIRRIRAVPRTYNGKIDRKTLKDIDSQAI